MSDFAYGDDKALYEAAKAFLADAAANDPGPLRRVVAKIDARRFAEGTATLVKQIESQVKGYFMREARAQTEAATIVPTGPLVTRGYGQNRTYEGGCSGTFSCSRAGKYPAPRQVDGNWAFVPSCKQHQEKAIENYGGALFRDARKARPVPDDATPLGWAVAWARDLGVDLQWYESDLKARGL